jgi:hypothetical protein
MLAQQGFPDPMLKCYEKYNDPGVASISQSGNGNLSALAAPKVSP